MVSIDYTTILVVINFVILLVILNKMLYKSIKKFLSERQEKINKDVKDAELAKIEAEKLIEKRDNEFKNARSESQKIINHAKKNAEDEAKQIISEAKDNKKIIAEQAQAEVELEKNVAYKELETQISKMIADVSSKILSGKIDLDSDKDLIDEALKAEVNRD